MIQALNVNNIVIFRNYGQHNVENQIVDSISLDINLMFCLEEIIYNYVHLINICTFIYIYIGYLYIGYMNTNRCETNSFKLNYSKKAYNTKQATANAKQSNVIENYV